MQKAERNPALTGGAFDIRTVTARIRAEWERRGTPAKQLVARLGLASESAWSKRIYPDKKDWVPFRADELSILAPLLFPGEPWRLFFDETISGIFREALKKKEIAPLAAWGVAEDPSPPPPASSDQEAGPKRRGRRTG